MSESFVEYQSLYTPQGYAATVITPAEVLIRAKEGPVWVALDDNRDDDRIVGTASAICKGDSLYIRGMAVTPIARGKSVGYDLLRHIETYASANAISRLFLSTTPFLDRAIRLYQTFGFHRTDEGPHELFGTPLFTMEKILLPRTGP